MTRLLLPQHQALITASGIADDVSRARGYWSATEKSDLECLGFPAYQRRVPALVIPVWNVYGEIETYQLRPDTPRTNAKTGKAIKYETQAGSRMLIDVPPGTRPQLDDPSIPLWITEGIRKADSGVSQGLAIVALLGVWNSIGTNAKGGKTVLVDWRSIALNGRTVYLAFDSDAATNRQVAAALNWLGQFLRRRDARVRYVRLDARQDAVHA
jgi:hypothetical protein